MESAVYYTDDLVQVTGNEIRVSSRSYGLTNVTAARVRWVVTPDAPGYVRLLLPTLFGLAVISFVAFLLVTVIRIPTLEYPYYALVSAVLTVLPVLLLAASAPFWKWIRRVLQLQYNSATVDILLSDSLAALTYSNITYTDKIRKAISLALDNRRNSAAPG